ncbi:MAG: hypothetical protein J5645_09990 [Lachnospiraceae bacterium]|nr:hypothetical protein [Lachnospiraceae bacterium]
MLITKLLGHKFRADEFESCSVSTGGGMTGGFRDVTLRREKDGRATVTVRHKEWHYEREEKTVYEASEEAFAHVAELVNKYDLHTASKRRMSRIRILDGDTTTVSFHFGKRYFSLRQLQRKSASARKGYREVIDYLNSLPGGEGVTTREPQQLRLLVDGYNLMFTVEDAFDEKLDAILCEDELTVTRFEDCGIVLCTGEAPETAESMKNVAGEGTAETVESTGTAEHVEAAKPVTVQTAAPCDLVYDPASRSYIVLYAEHTFSEPVWLLAKHDGYAKTAAPLVEKMNGKYRFYKN